MAMILQWVLTALALLLLAYILPGIEVSGFGAALIAALVLATVNFLVRPIVSLITLPINMLTLGLFSFVINALMFMLAAAIVPGFEVTNFISALIGSLLLALITGIFGSMASPRERHL